MTKLLQHTLGLNPQSWDKTRSSDHSRLKLAGVIFLIFSMISVISGIVFIYALTGSKFAGFIGGILLGLAFANIVRLALITIVIRFSTSLKPEAEEIGDEVLLVEPVENVNNQKAIQSTIKDKILVARSGIRNYLTITEVIRMTFILMVAVAVAFPFASFILRSKTNEILKERQEIIISQFKERHSDYQKERIESFITKTRLEKFPIHIYMELGKSSEGRLAVLLVVILACTPYFMLRNQQRISSRRGMNGYFAVNRVMMRKKIEEDHEKSISKAKMEMAIRYPEAAGIDIDPHAEYSNPPFNTEKKEPTASGWATEEQWKVFLTNV